MGSDAQLAGSAMKRMPIKAGSLGSLYKFIFTMAYKNGKVGQIDLV